MTERNVPAEIPVMRRAACGNTDGHWFSVNDWRKFLLDNNYCTEIADELAPLIFGHTQSAFNKGFERGVLTEIRAQKDPSILKGYNAVGQVR